MIHALSRPLDNDQLFGNYQLNFCFMIFKPPWRSNSRYGPRIWLRVWGLGVCTVDWNDNGYDFKLNRWYFPDVIDEWGDLDG